MINYRNTNIVFITVLVFLLGLQYFYDVDVPFIVYLLLLIVYSLLLFWGCYFINSGFFIPIVCSGDTNKKQIAISFDDGPASSYTTQILQILKEKNAQAAFFCIGNRIADNQQIFKQIHEEGHVIGNHSYSHHFWFDMYPTNKMLADLKAMDKEMKDILGFSPRLFRPPYGVTNPMLKKAIIQGNYIPIGWNVRSMDTVIKDEKKLLDKLSTSLKPGAIFLFHDTSATTLAVLPQFLDETLQSGYEIIRLDKMLKLQPYA